MLLKYIVWVTYVKSYASVMIFLQKTLRSYQKCVYLCKQIKDKKDNQSRQRPARDVIKIKG